MRNARGEAVPAIGAVTLRVEICAPSQDVRSERFRLRRSRICTAAFF